MHSLNQQTKQNASLNPLLFILSSVIDQYSQLPIQSKLFGNTLAIEIVTHLSTDDIRCMSLNLTGTQLAILSKLQGKMKAHNNRLYSQSKPTLTYFACFIHHQHYLPVYSGDKRVYTVVVRKVLDTIDNCIILLDDGTQINNLLFFESNVCCSNSKKTVLNRSCRVKGFVFGCSQKEYIQVTQLAELWQSNNQINQTSQPSTKKIEKTTKSTVDESVMQISQSTTHSISTFPKQLSSSLQMQEVGNTDKYSNKAKYRYDIAINTEQVANDLELFLSICELFHGHVHLKVCLYGFREYISQAIQAIELSKTEGSNPIAADSSTLCIRRLTGILLEGQYSKEGSNRDQVSQDSQDILMRESLPPSTQYFILNERASKITLAELRELQNELVLKPRCLNPEYCKEQNQISLLADQFNDLGTLLQISAGINSLVIWVTFRGLPVLLKIPSIKFNGRASKEINEFRSSLGFNRYTICRKLMNSYITVLGRKNEGNLPIEEDESYFSVESKTQSIQQQNMIFVLDLNEIKRNGEFLMSHQKTGRLSQLLQRLCFSFVAKWKCIKDEIKMEQNLLHVRRISEILETDSTRQSQMQRNLLKIIYYNKL